MRRGTLPASCPLVSRASIVTSVCDDPSSERTSGFAEIASERFISEGPDNGGGSTSVIVHPDARVAVMSTSAYLMYLVMNLCSTWILLFGSQVFLGIGIIAETDAYRRLGLDAVAHL